MPDHGTRGRYVAGGCRCDECRAAVVEYNKVRRHARKARQREQQQWEQSLQAARHLYDMPTYDEGDVRWHAEAACRGVGADVFFPANGSGNTINWGPALAVCARCPVRRACLNYALRTEQRHGVWGMCTPADLDAIRRRRQAVAS